ncbi:MAG: flavodoxin family protein [Candidatus Electrothrix sp. ATG1]|nr:flavodoxin family protein [Candidatus Electrothrix sp. ATG1]
MAKKKIVILDGARPDDRHLDPILTILTDVLLRKHHKSRVQTFKLRKIKLNPCIGCFHCFIKTPGRCLHSDAGADILQAILHCDEVFFFTPVVFGGYSSELKKMVDRFLPLALPFFHKVHGETHHPPRYTAFPRFVGIGVQSRPQKKQADCFKILVGRNAVNFYPSSYAAEVVDSTASPEILRSRFQALLSRTDELPLGRELTLLSEHAVSAQKISTGNHRVLLIVGSQKIRQPNTSAVLGGHLLNRLKQHGWKTKSLTLRKNLLYGRE